MVTVTSDDNSVIVDDESTYIVEDSDIDDVTVIYDDYGQASIAIVEFED